MKSKHQEDQVHDWKFRLSTFRRISLERVFSLIYLWDGVFISSSQLPRLIRTRKSEEEIAWDFSWRLCSWASQSPSVWTSGAEWGGEVRIFLDRAWMLNQELRSFLEENMQDRKIRKCFWRLCEKWMLSEVLKSF